MTDGKIQETDRVDGTRGNTMFSERLDFLMNLTGMQNNTVALAASIDASYISRLRKGSRRLPANQTYVLPMSRCFARQLKQPYQRDAMRNALHLDAEWPDDEEYGAQIIYAWLTENRKPLSSVSLFLKNFSTAKQGSTSTQTETPTEDMGDPLPIERCAFYYGVEGKRKGVIRFLTAVRASPQPQTILLFSDEEMDWLFNDAVFARQWAKLMTDILLAGNHIKIIHTVNRNVGEMMEAVTKWVPVYLTRAIEPFYYPKLRDGLFQRTVFIAPDTAAVVSNSVHHDSSEMLNLYLEDAEAIKALVTEFDRHLLQCRPLMSISDAVNAGRFWKEFIDLETANAPAIMVSSAPSLMTMPEDVATSIASRCGTSFFFDTWHRCVNAFDRSQNDLTEIVMPQAPEHIKSGTVPLPMADLLHADGICYTTEEYRRHLAYARALSDRFKKHLVLAANRKEGDFMIYGKEDIGIVVCRLHAPTVAFTFSEPNMTSAFWEYLSTKKSEGSSRIGSDLIGTGKTKG